MISTPPYRRFHGATLALFVLLAASLMAGRVHASRPATALASSLRSRISPDLQRLVATSKPVPGQPIENIQVGLARNLMLFDNAGRVGVTITARDVKALVPTLKDLNVAVAAADPEHFLLEAYVPISSLEALEGLAPIGLLGVMPTLPGFTDAGLATSQADFVLEADRTRATAPQGVTGAGVRIGVISDSYDRQGGAQVGINTGDLPNGVNVIREGSVGGSDEGRAMMELIHDLAPGAALAFSTGGGGPVGRAQSVRDLADPSKGNCRVIADDIFYLQEPFFQDGVGALAIKDAVQLYNTAYFCSAGNRASQAYDATYAPATDLLTNASVHDFDPGPGVDTRQRVTIPAGGSVSISLQWDQPFFSPGDVLTDMDLVLMQAGTNTVVASIASDNILSQTPNEVLSVTNFNASTLPLDLMIVKFSGPSPGRVKYVFHGSMSVQEFNTKSPTINSNAASDYAMAVGAVSYYDQSTGESFSSVGPSTILFSEAGVRLPSAIVRQKPDIAAVDGTDTSFFGSDVDSTGFPNFFGTSAAAPHAAAVAALVREAFPSMTATDVYNRLRVTADPDTGTPGVDNTTGAGVTNAYDAVFGPALPAALPFSDNFESTALGATYETHTLGAGQILLTGQFGPSGGNQHLILQSSRDTFGARNEVILHVNAAGMSGATLSFAEKEFGDTDQPMSPVFQGGENSDGVALSVDGVNWYRIASLTGATSTNAYQLQRYSLAAVAAGNGLTLGADTRIKFQQFGNLKTPRGGIAIDDISVANLSGISFDNTSYAVNESAGQATVTVLRAGNPALPLQADFTTANGTATAPGDYVAVSGTLLFQAGELSKTLQIPVVSDQLIEGPETVQLTLSNITGGVLLTPSAVTLTILDDADVVAPNPLTATAIGPSSVRLNWTDDSANEDGFEIERKSGVGSYAVISSVLPNANTYVDSGLSTNVAYSYRVRAIQGTSASSYSNVAGVNISPIEFESGTYTVSEDAGQLIVRVSRTGDILTTASVQLATVDGTAIAGNDYQAQAITVDFVRGETTKEILLPITADHILEPNETFDVVLSNAVGGSATLGDQKKTTVTITNGGALPAPSNLVAAVSGSAQVQLTWKDNCLNETAIDVERKAGQGSFSPLISLSADTEAYVDTSVSAGVVYTYRVKASQGGLESNYSNTASTAVTSLQFEIAAYSVLEDNATVTLKVTRSGDPSLPVTVKFATSDGTATTAGGDYVSSSSTLVFAPAETTKSITLSVNDDDRLEGPETFNVTLSNPTGTGAVVGSPAVAVVTITDNQTRLAPSSLTAMVLTGSQVRLNWSDNSGNETGFEVERKGLGGTFAKVGQAVAGTTQYTDTGLTANTAYSYRVRAISGSGTSDYSNVASITTLPPAPAAPSGLAAVVQDGGKVRLTWVDNSLNESGFVVERKDGAGSFAVVAGLGENSISYLDTGRAPGATYTYQVRAVNAGGESGNSNTVTVTLGNAPGTPTNLTANAVSGTTIRLSWTIGSNSTATKIERATNGVFVLVGTVAQGVRTFTDQSVAPDVTYTYQVRASSQTGDSEPSNTVQASISTLGRIKVTPTKIAFGRGKAGTDRIKTFIIKNIGSGSLGGMISGISQTGGANGPFEIVEGGEPFTLVRGQVREVTVRFRSANPGNFSGTLTITSTDPDHGSTTVSMSASAK